ncbi:MAG: hypothetical protein KDD62_07255 [Bdellovibrionales bacterium]|nr:hypothetical protein [Bdellovibrionales bacterium]
MSQFFFPKKAVVSLLFGPDSQRFLQARITQDIVSLSKNAWINAAAVTAQGKLQVMPLIIKKAEDEFLLLHEGLEFDELSPVILQFKVADRVDYTQVEDFSILHVAGNTLREVLDIKDQPLDGQRVMEAGACLYRFHDRGFGEGVDVIGPRDELRSIGERLKASGFEEPDMRAQFLARIRKGVLAFEDGLAGMFLPEAQLPQILSSTKGCYVGQEAIEMSLARGSLPAELYRFFFSAEQALSNDANFDVQGEQIPRISILASEFDEATKTVWGFCRVGKPERLSHCDVLFAENPVHFERFEALL